MTINDIPVKLDKIAITDTTHQLSAEEFNTVVDYIKTLPTSTTGLTIVETTLEEYKAMTTHDTNTYYIIVNSTEDDEAESI